ncbi:MULTISPECIES: hypothetical protein [unclassified Streptomyces]|uniref:hypothetical protein n=1 Tax=unclassified Streptomyces TaxID=2593676 RepID=UPI0036E8541A
MLLQCTAYTGVPEAEALVALATMPGGPDDPPEALDRDDFVLCELGEHDDGTEHAAQLWSAETPAERDLWLFWTDAGAQECTYRFAELSACPAVINSQSVHDAHACMLFVQHPGAHSWEVTDPLGDLLNEQAWDDVRRVRYGDDPLGGD